jgi:hypothetical protein
MFLPTRELMKHIAGVMALRRLSAACLLMGMLASCSNGADSAAPSASGAGILNRLLAFIRASGMSSPAGPTQAEAAIALSRISHAQLGELTLVLSNYLCQDPSGSGNMLLHPARTGQLASYSLSKSEQSADAVTVAMPARQFQIPQAGARVLVEVIDQRRNMALYGKLVALPGLAGLNIAVPETPLLAVCANPG